MTGSGAPDASSVFVENPITTLARLGRALRERGVPVGPDRIAEAAAAIATLGPTDLYAVYWAGRASLCSDPVHIAIYNELFAARGRRGHRSGRVGASASAPAGDGSATGGTRRPENEDGGGAGSRLEQLRRRQLSALSDAERAEILVLVAALWPRAESRARRRRSGGQARVDVGRTVEIMLRNGGEITAIARDRLRTKPRRLVVLIDVSRSIEDYTEFLLRFGYAAIRAAPNTTEVFTLGTQLTRLTRQLRHRVPAHAFAAAGTVIEDWHGGTRLGTSLGAFVNGWGKRGTARGAVLVIFSDGATTDVERLGVEARRLARLAHTVIWANPCVGRPKYRPIAPGLRAVEPHVTAFVPAGSLAALTELAALVNHWSRGRGAGAGG